MYHITQGYKFSLRQFYPMRQLNSILVILYLFNTGTLSLLSPEFYPTGTHIFCSANKDAQAENEKRRQYGQDIMSLILSLEKSPQLYCVPQKKVTGSLKEVLIPTPRPTTHTYPAIVASSLGMVSVPLFLASGSCTTPDNLYNSIIEQT